MKRPRLRLGSACGQKRDEKRNRTATRALAELEAGSHTEIERSWFYGATARELSERDRAERSAVVAWRPGHLEPVSRSGVSVDDWFALRIHPERHLPTKARTSSRFHGASCS